MIRHNSNDGPFSPRNARYRSRILELKFHIGKKLGKILFLHNGSSTKMIEGNGHGGGYIEGYGGYC